MFNGSYSGSDKVQISIEGGNTVDLIMDKHLFGIRLIAVFTSGGGQLKSVERPYHKL